MNATGAKNGRSLLSSEKHDRLLAMKDGDRQSNVSLQDKSAPMTILTTQRLILRPVEDRDAEPLHAIYSNSDAMRYWSRLPHTKMEETIEAIEDLKGRCGSNSFGLVIEYQGHAIGRIGLWQFPEIGFILHPDHWGKGLAREALDAMIAYGLETLGLEEVTADVDPRNAASIRLLERIGFVETGRAAKTFLLGEEWCDSIYFTLKKAEFRRIA